MTLFDKLDTKAVPPLGVVEIDTAPCAGEMLTR